MTDTVIGTGIYSLAQATRLTRVSSGRIRRWLLGYEHGARRRRSPPIWQGQLAVIEGHPALGFLDLMEVRFVDAFLNAGLSLRTIRSAAAKARELIGADHPFSTQKFRTDGVRVFAELQSPRGKKVLLDLDRSQLGLYDVIVPSLLEGIEFDQQGQAARWFPEPTTMPNVVIDPQRQFGQPIVKSGVQTAILADAVRVEGSVEAVARWYEVPEKEVRDAVLFEFKKAA